MFKRKAARSSAPTWVRVASASDVPPGALRAASTDREAVVLANVDGDIYALEDRCSHQDYPLSAGELEDDELECPFHGARFDVCTGRATQLPAITPVRSFQVEVRDGEVFIRLD
jgi:3-phenylpropionate/trans-cinnamate dioxygenase ferredoxin subunit